MAKKRFKKILKAALPYIIALIAGVILWAICTPYAKAHREDPSLVGGEACLPALTVLCVFAVKTIPGEIKEMIREVKETDEDDY